MTAVCFNQAGEHTKAEEYFTQAAKHYEKQSDKFNLARVQRDYGNCQMAQSKLDKAEELFSESIKNFEDTNDLGELAMTQVKLAALHAKQEKFDEASSQVYEGIQNANKSNNKFYISTAYKEAGRVYFLAKKYQAMIDCLYAALGALQLEVDSHAKQHAELYLSLAHAYEA
ncbi:MAG: tetratricopeptide repeat protein [Candidatus Nomurabacteria bacterium]|nr:MAG: tetratricopeptide repeat protein [Candidatus Nomurabacteria bacterium]